jgi:hypothetical protein
MELKFLQEYPDGSADVELSNVDPAIMQLIVQTGLIKLLEDAMKDAEEKNKLPALLRAKE